jgi:hypothetical protein
MPAQQLAPDELKNIAQLGHQQQKHQQESATASMTRQFQRQQRRRKRHAQHAQQQTSGESPERKGIAATGGQILLQCQHGGSGKQQIDPERSRQESRPHQAGNHPPGIHPNDDVVEHSMWPALGDSPFQQQADAGSQYQESRDNLGQHQRIGGNRDGQQGGAA